MHTLELVVAHAGDGRVRSIHVAEGHRDGLAERYARGATDGLLVFVGHVEKMPPSAGGGLALRCGLPKTDSANLKLRLGGAADGAQTSRVPRAVGVEYREPIAPMHAFGAALAFTHWAERHVAELAI